MVGASILAGCANDPVAESATNNPNVDVALLFSHDGCDVFRFRDGGYHYYVRCAGSLPRAQTTQDVTCVKGCTKNEQTGITTTEK